MLPILGHSLRDVTRLWTPHSWPDTERLWCALNRGPLCWNQACVLSSITHQNTKSQSCGRSLHNAVASTQVLNISKFWACNWYYEDQHNWNLTDKENTGKCMMHCLLFVSIAFTPFVRLGKYQHRLIGNMWWCRQTHMLSLAPVAFWCWFQGDRGQIVMISYGSLAWCLLNLNAKQMLPEHLIWCHLIIR